MVDNTQNRSQQYVSTNVQAPPPYNPNTVQHPQAIPYGQPVYEQPAYHQGNNQRAGMEHAQAERPEERNEAKEPGIIDRIMAFFK